MNEIELRKIFGQRVTKLRGAKSRAQLASEAGISVHMIHRIEAGLTGVRFPNIAKLANALRVKPAELFTGSVPAENATKGTLEKLVGHLASLSEKDLKRVEGLVGAMLKHP